MHIGNQLALSEQQYKTNFFKKIHLNMPIDKIFNPREGKNKNIPFYFISDHLLKTSI